MKLYQNKFYSMNYRIIRVFISCGWNFGIIWSNASDPNLNGVDKDTWMNELKTKLHDLVLHPVIDLNWGKKTNFVLNSVEPLFYSMWIILFWITNITLEKPYDLFDVFNIEATQNAMRNFEVSVSKLILEYFHCSFSEYYVYLERKANIFVV